MMKRTVGRPRGDKTPNHKTSPRRLFHAKTARCKEGYAEYMAAYMKKWRADNKEHVNTYYKKWRKSK